MKLIHIYFMRVMRLFQKKRSYKLVSMKKYCRSKGWNYSTIHHARSVNVYEREYCGTDATIETHVCQTHESYVAELKEGILVGGYSFALHGKYAFCDILLNDTANRVEMKDYGGDGCICYNDNKQLELSLGKVEYIKEGISLLGNGSFNYYHFLIEILARIELIDRLQIGENIPLLLDECVKEIPQFKECVEYVNVKKRPVKFLKQYSAYKVGKLIYPSYMTWLPFNYKLHKRGRAEDFMFEDSGIKYVRDIILNNLCNSQDKHSNKTSDKIYISRKNLKNTRLSNQVEVENKMKEDGFDIIYPEKMSFAEQVVAFYNAKCIVAVSGAALTNLVFCQEGTKIFVMMHKACYLLTWSTMAKAFGVDMKFVRCNVIKKGFSDSSDIIKANCKELVDGVKMI